MAIEVMPGGHLRWKGGTVRCALGRGGIRASDCKREGDGATPSGAFALRRVLYRADRIGSPHTSLPVQALCPEDGWSDDPADPLYNTQVKRPHHFSHEALWREDRLYDVIVVIGHNDDPVRPGRGSAIFLHVATDDYAPTAGCVALALDDLLHLLRTSRPGDTLAIRDGDDVATR